MDTINALIAECRKRNVTDLMQIAYVLATVFHETGGRMQPVLENLNYSAQGLANTWPSRYAVVPKAKVKVPTALVKKLAHNPKAIANNCYANRMGNGDEASGDGWKYRGRDLCQTTGKVNYRRCGVHAGVDLVQFPDRIMEPAIAACNIVCGMRDGWFTGAKLSDFINAQGTDYLGARKIINGTDKAAKVAEEAQAFYNALT
ncbi:hypothetical protein [Rufibacter hautae]|uniref:Glycoside hydrolase family 19 protein n=1 Tax=Rufibacter hautae TaxID=2595005 RepID=A0A5B6TGS4_9BACT|nr:hypothetical protein [Rufibacter hautae]KAA3438454.1 hypothetical protein FOA19_14560 [Rufibacter hautae]